MHNWGGQVKNRPQVQDINNKIYGFLMSFALNTRNVSQTKFNEDEIQKESRI